MEKEEEPRPWYIRKGYSEDKIGQNVLAINQMHRLKKKTKVLHVAQIVHPNPIARTFGVQNFPKIFQNFGGQLTRQTL